MDIAEDTVGMAGDTLEIGMSIGKSIASTLPTHHKCTVEITNECANYTLCNPRVHTERGCCSIPLQPTIRPSATRKATFSKIPHTATGSVGVFTYDLLNSSTKESTQKIAVMYKVPFDLNRKSNAYAVGVFDLSRERNWDLFREMSKDTNAMFVRGNAKGPSLTHKSQDVIIMATMSDCYTPAMKVHVCDD